MSSLDVEAALAEVEQLLDDLEGDTNVEQLTNKLTDITKRGNEVETKLLVWRSEVTSRLEDIPTDKERLEEQGAKLKNANGNFNLDQWRNVAESYKQARIDNTLQWLLALDPHENLDLLRDMSPNHKAALLNLERQLVVEKLDKATESIKRQEAEMSGMKSQIASHNNDIQAVDKARKSLEVQLSNLAASKTALQQRYDIVAGGHDVAQQKVKEGQASIAAQESEVARLTTEKQKQQDELMSKDAVISGLRKALSDERFEFEKANKQRLDVESNNRTLQDKNRTLQDELTRKDAILSRLGKELDDERFGHEKTDKQRLDSESKSRTLQDELMSKDAIVSRLAKELDDERFGHEKTDKQRLDNESKNRTLQNEVIDKDAIISRLNKELGDERFAHEKTNKQLLDAESKNQSKDGVVIELRDKLNDERVGRGNANRQRLDAESENQKLRDKLTSKDELILEVRNTLDDEKAGHAATNRQRLDAESENRRLLNELVTKDGIALELRSQLNDEKAGHGATNRQRLDAESKIGNLEAQGKKMSEELSSAKNRLAQQNLGMLSKDAELAKEKETSANKDSLLSARDNELQQLKEQCLRQRGLVVQANTELAKAKETSANKDDVLSVKDQELQQLKEQYSRQEDLLTQANADLAKERETSAKKDSVVSATENELQQLKKQYLRQEGLFAQANAELAKEKETSVRKSTVLSLKDNELKQLKEEHSRQEALFLQITAELEKVREDVSRKDADIEHSTISLKSYIGNLALLLMNPEQDFHSWLPLVTCLELTEASATNPAVDDARWWTVAPSWKKQQQQTALSSPARPVRILESISILYSEALVARWSEDGCEALQNIIHCLEQAEAAPIAMLIELIRCLLSHLPRGDDNIDVFGLIFGTCQIVSLLQLRWPDIDALADMEGQCRQMVERACADLQLIHSLVGGVERGTEVISAFMNHEEIPNNFSSNPHKYCPEHKTLLLAPTTDVVWALDLRHHIIWQVDKLKGRSLDYRHYQLDSPGGGESITIVAETDKDRDFIFDYLLL